MPQLAVNGGTPVWSQRWPAWPIFEKHEIEYLHEVLESGCWAFDGPYEAQFQRAFADFHTARHGLAVANGTVALQLALEALDIGYGDEVIVPANTWQATAAAALDVNAVPILVDIEPDTYCIDADKVAEAITPRTRAIIPVHLYANLADMDRLLSLARQHNLHVIEDCAHSQGSRWRDRGVGSLGDIGCFSFQSSKSLNAGEGGFVMSNDDRLFERLYSLRNCGRRRPDADPNTWEHIQSGNYRMTEWQSAILLAQLDRLPTQVARREASLRFLDGQLAQIEGVAPLARRAQVTRQGMYAYVFRYNPDAFAGAPVQAFRQALSAELGTHVGGVYEPLTNSPLYQPHTKRRYRINEEHWRAIDPARFYTPVAERAFRSESVVFSHPHLLGGQEAMQSIVDGCA
ncbi:MAG: DegT/DnrJ/EryC1/StrS family aminotransferase, partial [Chloroflexi bacterium]|nr:DegT/DnrJ/EryC1/StrS family aminotransferase [Chloroflexota bacterium]